MLNWIAGFIVGFIGFVVGYYTAYKIAIKEAGKIVKNQMDEWMKEKQVVVKKDERIIECNGMQLRNLCKDCVFGIKDDGGNMACFAPDYDGVGVFGVKKPAKR